MSISQYGRIAKKLYKSLVILRIDKVAQKWYNIDTKEREVHQMYNGEQILDRLAELYEYLKNFPNGWYAPIARKEIACLESLGA